MVCSGVGVVCGDGVVCSGMGAVCGDGVVCGEGVVVKFGTTQSRMGKWHKSTWKQQGARETHLGCHKVHQLIPVVNRKGANEGARSSGC